ncbi:MAG TPA: hypothetical protein PLV25_06000, partial [Opitutales bacterium]|nr:hypothetical protein [Opitutales bacterium]
PYPPEILEAIAQYVRDTLQASGFRFQPLPGPLVGTSGACSVSRSILAHRMGRPFSQAPNELSIFYLKALLHEVANMDHIKRAQIPQLPATRADIFPTSLITLITLLELTGSNNILHCPRNLRFGLAAKLLADLSG